MGYVAVKGGSASIDASLERLKYERLRSGTSIDTADIAASLRALVDQVMSEGSLYAECVAALALKQAEGSPEEAVFILRAFRSTLQRSYYSRTIEGDSMQVERRISSCFKDIPGGQVLGASADYSHRLIDPALGAEDDAAARAFVDGYLSRPFSPRGWAPYPRVTDLLAGDGLLRLFPRDDSGPDDVTKEGLSFPSSRSMRLQVLARGQTGAVTALGYASLRGYGAVHPTVAELRFGRLPVYVANPEGGGEGPDDDYYLGFIRATEVETVIPVQVPDGSGGERIEFSVGYGFCFGRNETKAIAMSLLDYCLEYKDERYPTHDEEFVLLHIDSVEATGFISHLKLPHYVTFQSSLDSARATAKGKIDE
ncbi:MAG: carbon-phosphorus lyase complex subunit PhnI [Treponema sp.]|nr:carbon-phosphorus lyase complex subunit PhnI [Treponema sp.]